MRSSTLLVTSVVLAAVRLLAAEPAQQSAAKVGDRTLVQTVTKKPVRDPRILATTAYELSDQERPLFDKLADEERKNGSFVEDYDIRKKDGVNVAWFGIVREIQEDKAASRTTLTVEHKYFDGLTDSHILALSFNGSGDFLATLQGIDHRIKPLSLIRAYGKARMGANDQPPQIDAVFVRNWVWGSFTFLSNYGQQRGSEKWRRLNQVKMDDIYDPDPQSDYYKTRLGDPPDLAAREAAFRDRGVKAADGLCQGAGKTIAPLLDRLLSAGSAADDAPSFDDVFAALRKVGAQKAAIAVFADALTSPKSDVRITAATYLEVLGPEAESASAALVAALDDESSHVRGRAASALGKMGALAAPAVPALIATTRDGDSHVRATACESLGQIGLSEGGALEALVKATEDENAFVRFMAVGALEEFGAKASSAARQLIVLLETDDEDSVRWQAAETLGVVDSQGLVVVPALIQALKTAPSNNVRRFAARGLSHIGANAKAAVPVLLIAVKDPDVGVRISVAEALWKVDKNAKRALAVLRPALVQGDWPSRMWAASATKSIGPDAREAIGELKAALVFPNINVQSAAADALGSIGGDDAALALEDRLDDRNGELRVSAARGLWRIKHDPRAVQALVSVLSQGDNWSQLLAAAAIREIGPPAKETEPALKEMLDSPSAQLRREAAAALGAVTQK